MSRVFANRFCCGSLFFASRVFASRLFCEAGFLRVVFVCESGFCEPFLFGSRVFASRFFCESGFASRVRVEACWIGVVASECWAMCLKSFGSVASDPSILERRIRNPVF